jgi:Cu/Ag efflux pump CusA
MDRAAMTQDGLSAQAVNSYVQTAMNGAVVSEVLDGMRTFDLVVRMKDEYREDIGGLKRLAIHLPEGGTVPLGSIAKIYESGGPNAVNRENVRRRVVIQCNVQGPGRRRCRQRTFKKPFSPSSRPFRPGYYPTYEGQFQSQQSASQMIAILCSRSHCWECSLCSYTLFRSVNLALQVMAALPMAFIGSVAALVWTGQTVTIAAMVGFISLAGIASRNGVLLASTLLASRRV